MNDTRIKTSGCKKSSELITLFRSAYETTSGSRNQEREGYVQLYKFRESLTYT